MTKATRKTKIVATLGPASSSPQMIRKLVRNGANVFRINFSHGTIEEHTHTIEAIKSTACKTGTHCGILTDLQGPKIRTGRTENDRAITLRKGKHVLVTSEPVLCSENVVSIGYKWLSDEVGRGRNILINDGAIRLEVLSVDKSSGSIRCVVRNTGDFSSHKGVNLPGVKLRLPSLTRKDRKDLGFILTQDVQFIALSFVRGASDLGRLKRIAAKNSPHIKIIAKIEKPEAALHIDEILSACDGIMVARGDLGVETSPERIPLLQKDLITRANEKGKIVIVATQMLDSMIRSPLPTRAESTDVANAILDGADALMLSGETAVGMYPAKAVETMAKIALAIEKSSYYPASSLDLTLRYRYAPHSVCEAAATASRDLGNIPVVVFTLSGDTALYLAKIRNQSPIYAFSPNTQVVSMLSMAWNTTSFHLAFDKDIVSLQRHAEEILLRKRCVARNGRVVIVSGTSPVLGATNFIRVKDIGKE